MKPISMACAQEQWDELRPILKANGKRVENIGSFEKYTYIVNNIGGDLGLISNIQKGSISNYNRQVHETYDKEIFLNACDISTVPTLEDNIDLSKITKEMVLELCKEPNIREVFVKNGVVNFELLPNVWNYVEDTYDNKFLIFGNKYDRVYYVGKDYDFYDNSYHKQEVDWLYKYQLFYTRPATPEEIEKYIPKETLTLEILDAKIESVKKHLNI